MTNLKNISDDLDHLTVALSKVCSPEECLSHIPFQDKCLKIITQNMRSIYKNINSFEALMCSLRFDCDVIVLTECRLSNSKPPPLLPNYIQFYNKKLYNQNDGVVVFTRNGMDVSVDELPFEGATCLSIKISNITAILALYRSPCNKNNKLIDSFYDSLEKTLSTLNQFKNIIVLGDINIDIGPNSVDRNRETYLNLTAEQGLLPAHTIPTHDRTCLDHILLRSKSEARVFVLNSSVTDHNAVLLCLDQASPLNKSPIAVTKTDWDGVLKDLKLTNFTETLRNHDVNEDAEKLVNIISEAVQRHTKKVHIPCRSRVIKPWITPGLLRCIKNRNNLHKKAQKSPNNMIVQITYKRYRSYCNKILRNLKLQHNKKQLQEASGNPKKTWKTIKEITHTTTSKSYSNELLSIDSSPEKSIETVNNFFATVGSKLAGQIDMNGTGCYIMGDTQSPLNSMVLLETDEKEVESIVTGLKSDSATGCDNIPSKVLKLAKSVIVPPLTNICNLAIRNGIFPNIFKRALIHPIHKAGDRHSVNNYRPISVLPALSKVLERLLNKRLIQFLDKNNILSKSQFGFRPKKSTEDAVTGLLDVIVSTLENKNKSLAIFLDLAKAFDTVSIPILVTKMERLGIRGTPLKLFKDYLTNRVQRVKLGDLCSLDAPVSFGVPQGSILGPSLFLIYINDLCDYNLQNGHIFTYADDTALVFQGKTWDETFRLAQDGFQKISDWLKSNLLTLNTQKTKYVTFSMRKTTQPPSSLTIKAHKCDFSRNCSCAQLEQTSSIRYLGVTLDNTLSWKSHIDVISGRCRKLIWVFKNLRYAAELDLIKCVYFALCQSVLTYCISAWGGAYKTTIKKLEHAQRSVLKVMTCKPFRYPTLSLYSFCKVMSVRQLYIYNAIVRHHITLKYDHTLYTTRRKSHNICKQPKLRTTFGAHQNTYLAPYLYNKLNKTLDFYPLNKNACKYHIRQYLLSLDYDTTESLLRNNI